MASSTARLWPNRKWSNNTSHSAWVVYNHFKVAHSLSLSFSKIIHALSRTTFLQTPSSISHHQPNPTSPSPTHFSHRVPQFPSAYHHLFGSILYLSAYFISVAPYLHLSLHSLQCFHPPLPDPICQSTHLHLDTPVTCQFLSRFSPSPLYTGYLRFQSEFKSLI